MLRGTSGSLFLASRGGGFRRGKPFPSGKASLSLEVNKTSLPQSSKEGSPDLGHTDRPGRSDLGQRKKC